MLSAISSMIGKTIDIFLRVNSSERRRKKFAKQLFDIYISLDEVVAAIDNIQLVVKDISQQDEKTDSVYQYVMKRENQRSKLQYFFQQGKKTNFDPLNQPRLPEYIRMISCSSTGSLTYVNRFLDEQGVEKASTEYEIDQRRLLPAILSNEIRMLNKAFNKIAQIMEAESWELFHAQSKPRKLKALSVYDKKLADTFVRAWFTDGGFIEALLRLGIHYEIVGSVLKLRDAEFGTPQTPRSGFHVIPEETIYDLRNPDHVESFLTFSESCKVTVKRARDLFKVFIAKNCEIEDIL